MKRASKPIKAWAMFYNGKFLFADCWQYVVTRYMRDCKLDNPSIYKYECRRVEIREVPLKKKARKT